MILSTMIVMHLCVSLNEICVNSSMLDKYLHVIAEYVLPPDFYFNLISLSLYIHYTFTSLIIRIKPNLIISRKLKTFRMRIIDLSFAILIKLNFPGRYQCDFIHFIFSFHFQRAQILLNFFI